MLYKYAHPEWFKDLYKPNLKPGDNVILWGAGKLGSIVAHSVEKIGIKIIAFVDIAKDKQGTKFYGYPIISPEQLHNNYDTIPVIVSCAFPIVYQQLIDKKENPVYDPHSFLLNVDYDGYHGEMTFEFASRITDNALRNYALYYGQGYLIERLMFVITDVCTLNCRNCDGYIPFIKTPKYDSLSTIIDSYNKIMSVCKFVETIDLLGGEPLTHPEIDKITDYFVNDTRCSRVMIISNGTIIPNEGLIRVLKSPKCTLRISDYGRISKRINEIIALCEKENIHYEITNYKYWDKPPVIMRTNETEKQLDEKYNACTTNLFYVKRSRIFHCTFLQALCSIDEKLIPDFSKNYVDLNSPLDNVLADKINRFAKQLHEHKHIDACKYCPGSHCIQFEDKQPVAEQAQGKLSKNLLYKDGVQL